MACNGAVILTEDRIIMFGSKAAASASASDAISGTTLCTSICCCFPCCYGKQSPTSRNSLFPSQSLASWVPWHPPPSRIGEEEFIRILVDTVEGPGAPAAQLTRLLCCDTGFCGCIGPCKVTKFHYQQLAHRENEGFQTSIKLSAAEVSFNYTTMTDLTREYTVCALAQVV